MTAHLWAGSLRHAAPGTVRPTQLILHIRHPQMVWRRKTPGRFFSRWKIVGHSSFGVSHHG